MKKLMSVCLSAMMAVGLCACSTENTASSSAAADPESVTAAYEEKAVSVDSSTGDYSISAVLTTPSSASEKTPLVVMLHGFGGNKDEGNGFVYIARTLAKYGIASIRMDFAGTGEDTREFTAYTLDSAAADALDCVAYALNNADIDETKLGIFGYSNGGRITTQITGEDPEKFSVRVLLAPAVFEDTSEDAGYLEECEETGYREMEWFGNVLNVSREYYESTVRFGQNLKSYEQVEMPTLVIHGTADVMVTDDMADAYVSATGSDMLEISGADHGYGFYSNDEASFETMDTIANAAAAFFAQHFTEDNAAAMFGN